MGQVLVSLRPSVVSHWRGSTSCQKELKHRRVRGQTHVCELWDEPASALGPLVRKMRKV